MGKENGKRTAQFDDIAKLYDENLKLLLTPYMVDEGISKFAEYKI